MTVRGTTIVLVVLVVLATEALGATRGRGRGADAPQDVDRVRTSRLDRGRTLEPAATVVVHRVIATTDCGHATASLRVVTGTRATCETRTAGSTLGRFVPTTMIRRSRMT